MRRGGVPACACGDRAMNKLPRKTLDTGADAHTYHSGVLCGSTLHVSPVARSRGTWKRPTPIRSTTDLLDGDGGRGASAFLVFLDVCHCALINDPTHHIRHRSRLRFMHGFMYRYELRAPSPRRPTIPSRLAITQVGARARSAPAFGAERVARGSDPAATGHGASAGGPGRRGCSSRDGCS